MASGRYEIIDEAIKSKFYLKLSVKNGAIEDKYAEKLVKKIDQQIKAADYSVKISKLHHEIINYKETGKISYVDEVLEIIHDLNISIQKDAVREQEGQKLIEKLYSMLNPAEPQHLDIDILTTRIPGTIDMD